MIEIDGSVRSGSGVIVRQAVAYAALTGQSAGGWYAWDIGTAWSANHAAARCPAGDGRARPGGGSGDPGGLFQDFAPSVFHLQHVVVPLIAQTGITAELGIIRPGYVPAGEGAIRLTVMPTRGQLRPLTPARGEARRRILGISLASHLEERRVAEPGPPCIGPTAFGSRTVGPPGSLDGESA